jgi:hypothetical protein
LISGRKEGSVAKEGRDGGMTEGRKGEERKKEGWQRKKAGKKERRKEERGRGAGRKKDRTKGRKKGRK